MALVERLFNDLSGSETYNILTQYHDNFPTNDPTHGYHPNRVRVGGTYVETRPFPRAPLSGSGHRGRDHAGRRGDGPLAPIRRLPHDIFFVFTPVGVQTCLDPPATQPTCSGTQFAGFHSYIPLPLEGSTSDCARFDPEQCALPVYAYLPTLGAGASGPYPNNAFVDPVLDTTWHELTEAVSDSWKVGYHSTTFNINFRNLEMADVCNPLSMPDGYGPRGRRRWHRDAERQPVPAAAGVQQRGAGLHPRVPRAVRQLPPAGREDHGEPAVLADRRRDLEAAGDVRRGRVHRQRRGRHRHRGGDLHAHREPSGRPARGWLLPPGHSRGAVVRHHPGAGVRGDELRAVGPGRRAVLGLLEATQGVAPYSWAVQSGVVPPGVNLSTAGVLSGTPTTAGTYSFVVQVTDSSSAPGTATKALSITIANGPFRITTASLPNATLGVPYSKALVASDGIAPYKWKKLSTLPTGLKLNAATGVISGTPKKLRGTFTFTVQASYKTKAAKQPAVTHTATRTLSITIS